jgi:plasmid stabilization system protein ParE
VRVIRWTAEASDQLEVTVKRIEQDNPAAARKVAQTIIDRIEQLATFPGLGRPGEVKGTRELVSPPYGTGARLALIIGDVTARFYQKSKVSAGSGAQRYGGVPGAKLSAKNENYITLRDAPAWPLHVRIYWRRPAC